MFFRLLAIIAMATGVLSAYPGLKAEFNKASTSVKKFVNDNPLAALDEKLLPFYANYKIATEGAAKGSPPNLGLDRIRFNAWAALGDKSPEQAMYDYIAYADQLFPGWRE